MNRYRQVGVLLVVIVLLTIAFTAIASADDARRRRVLVQQEIAADGDGQKGETVLICHFVKDTETVLAPGGAEGSRQEPYGPRRQVSR